MRLINFKRELLYITAGFFSLFLIWVAALSIGTVTTHQTSELRTKIPSGRIEMTHEAFLQTPYVIDSILDKNVDLLFYQRPPGQISGLAEHIWRVYAHGESKITLNFSYINSATSTPRVWLYDERGQLIQSGAYKGGGFKNGTFLLTIPSHGMYKVKLSFLYENVSEIRISGENKKNVLSYKDYIKENIKSIDLVIISSELKKLQRLVRKAKKIWTEPTPSDVLWPRYPGIKGKIVGTLKTKLGSKVRVAIGLSGRSNVHLPTEDTPLPSLDIKVLSGPLPYGLQRFKLYTAHGKYLNEIIHTSILNDHGLIVPRHDYIDVALNGRSVGKMLLMESVDASFFEAAQRIEGPIFGYDPDDALSRFNDNTFSVKNFSGKKQENSIQYPDLASPLFAKRINTLQILLAQSYGLTYAAYHGLGQADLRYHWNSRSETFDPIIKDLDAGILAPTPGVFVNAWNYFHPFAPLWRPNAVSVGSYYIKYSAKGRDENIYDRNGGGLFLWHTPPSTLNLLENWRNLKTIGSLNHMWASQWSRLKIKNRLSNLNFALGDNIGEYSVQITQDLLPESLWDPTRHTPTNDVLRIGRLISDLTENHVNPTIESLIVLDWRNVAIRQIYGKQKSNDISLAPSQILTFLYRYEEADLSNIIFVERNPNNSRINVRLKSTEGVLFEPEAIRFYNGRKEQKNIRDIELSDIKENEAVRLYWFKIKRNETYQYVFPVILGAGLALTPREMVIGPKYKKVKQAPKNNLAIYFDKKGPLLTFKKQLLSIDGEVIIPSGASLLIESNMTVKFRKTGCLKIYGDLKIPYGASLTLAPEVKEEGWSGIHFYNGNDIAINNLHVEGVGYGESNVTCGKSILSGGVSFFNTKVVISNTDIKDSRVEDSLHVLNSEIDARNLTIQNTKWDCLDSDYSVLKISDSKFKNCGGDGLDFSGSLFFLNNIRVTHNTDKGISVGENSRGYIRETKIQESDIGIASKDASLVFISKSSIEKNRVGIAVYSKKPYFPEPKIEFDKSVVFDDNRINVTTLSNESNVVNRSIK